MSLVSTPRVFDQGGRVGRGKEMKAECGMCTSICSPDAHKEVAFFVLFYFLTEVEIFVVGITVV